MQINVQKKYLYPLHFIPNSIFHRNNYLDYDQNLVTVYSNSEKCSRKNVVVENGRLIFKKMELILFSQLK